MSSCVAKIRLFLDQPLATGQTVPLSRDQAHYLTGVMRLGAGAAVAVFEAGLANTSRIWPRSASAVQR